MVVVAARILIRTVLLAAMAGALLIMLVFIGSFILKGYQGTDDLFISVVVIVLCVIVICGGAGLMGCTNKKPKNKPQTMYETIYGEELNNSHEIRGY